MLSFKLRKVFIYGTKAFPVKRDISLGEMLHALGISCGMGVECEVYPPAFFLRGLKGKYFLCSAEGTVPVDFMTTLFID